MTVKSGKTVFVTVGTTKFDLLIHTLTQNHVLDALKEKGYANLIVQVGNGKEVPNVENAQKAHINLTYYTFKNSIIEDILNADLIISHAGAGTCLEVLEAKRPLIVVVNEELMENHQKELAHQLSLEGYLYSSTCNTLCQTLKTMDLCKLKEMPSAFPSTFADYLNEFMGFK